MLTRLGQDGGTSTKSGTVLGQILSYSDKSNTLLENISKLTEMDHADESRSIDILLGTAKPKTTTGVVSSMIQFSAQTTSARLKAHIMHKLIKKGKDTMGAPRGRKVLVFVDDLNMPAPEVYGAQPPLELLRQFLELGGFYHAGKAHLVWKVRISFSMIKNHFSKVLLMFSNDLAAINRDIDLHASGFPV